MASFILAVLLIVSHSLIIQANFGDSELEQEVYNQYKDYYSNHQRISYRPGNYPSQYRDTFSNMNQYDYRQEGNQVFLKCPDNVIETVPLGLFEDGLSEVVCLIFRLLGGPSKK